MSGTGLEVFDRSVQHTNIWLDEVMTGHGADRQRAWDILGAVVRALRDQLPVDLAAELGAQLPLVVRGAYYERFEPSRRPARSRTLAAFLAAVEAGLEDAMPVDATEAARSVFHVLSHSLDAAEVARVRAALPVPVRALWPLPLN